MNLTFLELLPWPKGGGWGPKPKLGRLSPSIYCSFPGTVLFGKEQEKHPLPPPALFPHPSSIPPLPPSSIQRIHEIHLSNYHFPSSFFIHIHPEPASGRALFLPPLAFFRVCFVATLLLLLRLLSTDRPGRISPQDIIAQK